MARQIPHSESGLPLAHQPLLIGLNAFPGVSGVHKSGNNPTVGTSFEDLWHFGGSYEPLQTPTVMEVASDSADDTLAGAGAQVICLVGLDTDKVVATELLNLAGQTVVTSTTTFHSISRAYVVSGVTNVGAIYVALPGAEWSNGVPINASIAETVIGAGRAESQHARYTVPANHAAYLANFWVTSNSDKNCDWRLNVQSHDSGIKRVLAEGHTKNGEFQTSYEPHIVFTTGETVSVSAKVASGSGAIAAGLHIYLVDNAVHLD